MLVFIFFGPVAVAGTVYVQVREVSLLAWLACVAIGLLVVAILVVNNLRDIESDRRVGKRTLAVRLGAGGTQAEYILTATIAYLIPPLLWLTGAGPAWVNLAWLSFPLAFRLFRTILTERGRALNVALAETGQLTLAYVILLSAGLVIACYL